jgi:hypothetical protein
VGAITSDRDAALPLLKGASDLIPADYSALSRARFAARAWLQTSLLWVLGEVISEREADLVLGV